MTPVNLAKALHEKTNFSSFFFFFFIFFFIFVFLYTDFYDRQKDWGGGRRPGSDAHVHDRSSEMVSLRYFADETLSSSVL